MKSTNKNMLVSRSGSSHLNVVAMLLVFCLAYVLGLISNTTFQNFYIHTLLAPFLPSLSPSPTPPLLTETPPCACPPLPSSSLTPMPPPQSPPERSPCMGRLMGFLEPSRVMHNMTDEELLWRASMAPRIRHTPHRRVPKVAFLFLVRGELPLRPLWEKFFAGHQGLYSIYVHTDPAYAGSPPTDSVFYGRMIPSQNTSWGEPNLVEAERRLLANALLDLSNSRFALLSEACIPIFDFPTVYAHLTGSGVSFVDSLDDQRTRVRYNPVYAQHNVSRSCWRRGNQWFEMDRALALEVVSDEACLPVLRGFFDARYRGVLDEHYVPTLVSILGWSARIANRSLTYLEWHPGTSHPWTHGPNNVTLDLFRKMRGGAGKKCSYNGGVSSICFLFARKFSGDALGKLLELAPKVMGFG